MHRVFNIPELVLLVSREFGLKKDLYRFGTTCRGLWSLVESEVWREVHAVMIHGLIPDMINGRWASFSPSVKRLCDQIEVAHITADDEVLDFTEDPEKFTDPSKLQLGKHSFQDVMLFLCRGPEFHNLRELKLALDQTVPVYLVDCLFPSLPQAIRCLRILLLDSDGWGPYMHAIFMRAIQRIQLRLHEVHIDGVSGRPHIKTRVPPYISRLLESGYAKAFTENAALRPEMRSLSLFCICDGTRLLPVLSELPKLMRFDLSLNCVEQIPRYTFPLNAFPCLKAAAIDSDNATYHPPTISFFKRLCSEDLHEVAFKVKGIHKCVEVLTLLASRWTATLHDVILAIETGPVEEAEEIAPISKILRPLVALQHLTHICLYHESCFSLTVDDMQRLVAAFPHVEDLGLRLDYVPLDGDRKRPHTGPRILGIIAEGLPRLGALIISVDFDLDADWTPGPRVQSSTAVRLGLDESWCSSDNAYVTAAHIKTIFPNLMYFTCRGRDHMDKVKTLLDLPQD